MEVKEGWNLVEEVGIKPVIADILIKKDKKWVKIMGNGFMGSQYVWNTGNYRKYYHVIGNKVEVWTFEYDRKTKRYLPYGPGQKTMSLEKFKRLKKVRPGIKKIK